MSFQWNRTCLEEPITVTDWVCGSTSAMSKTFFSLCLFFAVSKTSFDTSTWLRHHLWYFWLPWQSSWSGTSCRRWKWCGWRFFHHQGSRGHRCSLLSVRKGRSERQVGVLPSDHGIFIRTVFWNPLPVAKSKCFCVFCLPCVVLQLPQRTDTSSKMKMNWNHQILHHVSQRTGVDVSVMNAAVLSVGVFPVCRTLVTFAEAPSWSGVRYVTETPQNHISSSDRASSLDDRSVPYSNRFTSEWRCGFGSPSRRKSRGPWQNMWRWTPPRSSPALEDGRPTPSPDLNDTNTLKWKHPDFCFILNVYSIISLLVIRRSSCQRFRTSRVEFLPILFMKKLLFLRLNNCHCCILGSCMWS